MNEEMEKHLPCIETLSHKRFFVPRYQRGYRWTPDEVTDLLEDIRQFAAGESHAPDEFYCLQPLVVHRMDCGQWEVIDGQQRLTTVYLVTRYIKEMWPGQDKDTLLSLHYGSRERTEAFLKRLTVDEKGSVAFNDENIDFAHISRAYQAIGEWVQKLGSELDKDQFMSAFRRRVRVIWYEPFGSKGVEIFTRINSGKIPLTNAELIRGLFLRSSNFIEPGFSERDRELARLRQMEISAEWDSIEATLHDDKFWYFLTDKKDPAETRIDLVFRLLTGVNDPDSYALFRAYSGRFTSRSDVGLVLKNWTKVKECFQQLRDWYLDWDLYHIIGYLVETGTPLNALWEESRGLRKSEFKKRLKERVEKSLPGSDKWASLEYGNSQVRSVLLLHNILTTLASKERHFRFPFNRFKGQRWDVEHIHSVAEKIPATEPHQREWLKDASGHLPDRDLQKKVAEFLGSQNWDMEQFEKLYNDVLKAFAEKGQIESINDLSNLALLDQGTNRGYGNEVFPAKRAKIIARERDGWFVPIATKNAFMKYYSTAVDGFTFWSESDREAYFEAMQETITSFLKGEEEIRNESA
jgi:hypothetical protein